MKSMFPRECGNEVAQLSEVKIGSFLFFSFYDIDPSDEVTFFNLPKFGRFICSATWVIWLHLVAKANVWKAHLFAAEDCTIHLL